MILDARSFAANTTIETDVCIIGGGTAGITLAREFIGQPFRVCLLESGGRNVEPETQALATGENIGFPYYPLADARARIFGGSSTLWHVAMGGEKVGARLRPLDPLDFETRDWVPFSGWPFNKTHLEPYYNRAQTVCQVEPVTFDTENWADPKTRPPLQLSSNVQTIIYKIGSRDPFVHNYPEQVASAANITTCLHANVLEIETNATGDCVTRLRASSIGGPEFHVTARSFIIAVGGIEIPRLLLLSNKTQSAGLGNQNDLVGRFFMEHPHFWAGVFIPDDPEIFKSTTLYNDVHTINGVAIIGKLALTEETLRREKLLNQNIQLMPWMPSRPENPISNWGTPPPLPPSAQALKALLPALEGEKVPCAAKHVRRMLSGLDDVVAVVTRKMRDKLFGVHRPPAFVLANMMEQCPNPQSRITLGKDRDVFNQPQAQLDWKIMAEDIRSARRTHEIIGSAWERSGMGRFYKRLSDETPPPTTHGGYHHMGTTRMHEDPKQGVVDAKCKVHGINNLYVAGPSVFPTGGYANPTLTLIALAIRLADLIKELFQ